MPNNETPLKITIDSNGNWNFGNPTEKDTLGKIIADGRRAFNDLNEIYENTLNDSGLSPILVSGNKDVDKGFVFNLEYDPTSGLNTKLVNGKLALSLDPLKNDALKLTIKKVGENDRRISALENGGGGGGTITITTKDPLTITKGEIGLTLGEGLTIKNKALVLDADSTIIKNLETNSSDALTLAKANQNDISTLKQTDTDLGNRVTALENKPPATITAKAPITNNAGEIGLSLKQDGGLTIDANALTLDENSTLISTISKNAENALNLVNANDAQVKANTKAITDLTPKVSTLEGQIANTVTLDGSQTIDGEKIFTKLPKTNLAPTENEQLTNKSYVDSEIKKATAGSGGNYVTLDTAQTITAQKTHRAGLVVEKDDKALAIAPANNNKGGYLAFENTAGGVIGVLGKLNTTYDQIQLEAKDDDLIFKAPQNKKIVIDGGLLDVQTPNIQAYGILKLGTNIWLGNGGNEIRLRSDNQGKDIKFGLNATTDNNRLNLDLENRSKIKNVPTPTDDGDAVNKLYVDNKFTSGGLSFTYPLKQNGQDVSLAIKTGGGLKIDNNELALDETSSVFTNLENKITANTTLIGQTETKLQDQIDSLKGAIFFVGVIQQSESAVTQNLTLLDNYVTQQTGRSKRAGDLVRTNDGADFIWNGQNWVKSGSSAGIANETKAGLIKLGSADGELSDKGSGLVEVIGFANVKDKANQNASKLSTIEPKVSSLEAQISKAVTTDTKQTITEEKTFDVLPKSTANPTNQYQFVNKGYVDSAVAQGTPTPITFDLPLKNANNVVSLQIDDNSLAIQGGVLSLETNKGIIKTLSDKATKNANDISTINNEVSALKQTDTSLDTRLKAIENKPAMPVLSFTNPLSKNGNDVSLKINADNFDVSSGALDLKPTAGVIKGINDSISTIKGDVSSLKSKDSDLDTRLKAVEARPVNPTISATAPLKYNNGVFSLALKANSGLKVESNELTVDPSIGALKTALDSKANNSDVVKLTGNQTINGGKTFTNNLTLNADLNLNQGSIQYTATKLLDTGSITKTHGAILHINTDQISEATDYPIIELHKGYNRLHLFSTISQEGSEWLSTGFKFRKSYNGGSSDMKIIFEKGVLSAKSMTLTNPGDTDDSVITKGKLNTITGGFAQKDQENTFTKSQIINHPTGNVQLAIRSSASNAFAQILFQNSRPESVMTIGKTEAGSNKSAVISHLDDLLLKAPNNKSVIINAFNIAIDGSNEVKVKGSIFTNGKLKMGNASSQVILTSDSGAKPLKFGENAQNYFNLDLENRSGLTGLKDPTQERDATHKKYVDDAIANISAPTISGSDPIEVSNNRVSLKIATDGSLRVDVDGNLSVNPNTGTLSRALSEKMNSNRAIEFAKLGLFNVFTESNTFRKPITIAPAVAGNDAVTKQQMEDAIQAVQGGGGNFVTLDTTQTIAAEKILSPTSKIEIQNQGDGRSGGYAFRFNADQINSARTVQLFRIHKGGDKGSFGFVFGGNGAYEGMKINPGNGYLEMSNPVVVGAENALKIRPGGNNQRSYLEFQNTAKEKIGMLGKVNTNNDQMQLESARDDFWIKVPNNKKFIFQGGTFEVQNSLVQLNNEVRAFGDVKIGNRLTAGNGANNLRFKTDSGEKTIYLGADANNNNNRWHIDCEGRTKIKRLPTPTDAGDATPKSYVDSKLGVFLPPGTQPTTSNVPDGTIAFITR